MIIPDLTLVDPADHNAALTWYLVFCDWTTTRRAPLPIHWFTRKGFRHVFALRSTKLGTVILNTLLSSVFVEWVPYDVEACAIACRRRGWIVVKVVNQSRKDYGLRGFISCVSVVKAAIGIKRWWIVTPYQLYKHLEAGVWYGPDDSDVQQTTAGE
jgi:hypothetical protein